MEDATALCRAHESSVILAGSRLACLQITLVSWDVPPHNGSQCSLRTPGTHPHKGSGAEHLPRSRTWHCFWLLSHTSRAQEARADTGCTLQGNTLPPQEPLHCKFRFTCDSVYVCFRNHSTTAPSHSPPILPPHEATWSRLSFLTSVFANQFQVQKRCTNTCM